MPQARRIVPATRVFMLALVVGLRRRLAAVQQPKRHRGHEHVDGSDAVGVIRLRRKLRRLGEGAFGLRTMYLATVAWLIAMPSLRNSPWIRGAPQRG
jgi:hypothetical protein